jgi:hypothetical protein
MGGFENVDRAADIGFQHGARAVRDGGPEERKSRKMVDNCGFFLRHKRAYGGVIPYFEWTEPARRGNLGQRGGTARANYFDAVGSERKREPSRDKARYAGDQYGAVWPGAQDALFSRVSTSA